MTVVGRASISRWVVEEILEQFFHPALEPSLSRQLKDIERNIRLYSPSPQTLEEDDTLSTKVCNWRLTTLDALQDQINSKQALEARQVLSELLVNKLVTSLQQHLHQPAPPGLLGGVQMVIDIAIGLAANLPVESRDVRVWYPMPGFRFDSKYMKVDGGLPALLAVETDKMQIDSGSTKSGEGEDSLAAASQKDEKSPSSRAGIAALPPQQTPGKDKGRATGFGNKFKKALHGNPQTPPPPSPGLGPSVSSPVVANGKGAPSVGQSGQGSQVSLQQAGGESKTEVEKIRVAGFMAVEVRGRSILVKASVWL